MCQKMHRRRPRKNGLSSTTNAIAVLFGVPAASESAREKCISTAGLTALHKRTDCTGLRTLFYLEFEF